MSAYYKNGNMVFVEPTKKESGVSDIVERLEQIASGDSFAASVARIAADEIESLRQRVKELMDINYALEEQVRALKAGQGEPVARQQTPLQDIYDKLYTSAPSIPEGENEAVRMFLMFYGGNGGITVNEMRANMDASGFYGYWPGWVEEAENLEHLTKAGAQSWLRHLFIAAAPKKS